MRHVQLRSDPGVAGHGEAAVGRLLPAHGGDEPRQVAPQRDELCERHRRHRPHAPRERVRGPDATRPENRLLLHGRQPQGAAEQQGRPRHAVADKTLAK